jgi:hypothetical protein
MGPNKVGVFISQLMAKLMVFGVFAEKWKVNGRAMGTEWVVTNITVRRYL